MDWQVRDSVRAQLKILVRRTLQRWKYPPDKAAEAIELVMKQAEQLSNAWTTRCKKSIVQERNVHKIIYMLFLGETFEKIDKVTITNVFWGNNAYRKS